MTTPMTMVERLWAKVDKRAPDECWLWTGCRSANRRGQFYGYFNIGRKMVRVSRLMVELATGTPVPADKVVRHTCDNSICCNPSHLIVGTQKENVADRYARGRARHLRGSAHQNAKLKDEDVPKIRVLLAQGLRHKDIGAMFGVSAHPIDCISTGKGWKHV